MERKNDNRSKVRVTIVLWETEIDIEGYVTVGFRANPSNQAMLTEDPAELRELEEESTEREMMKRATRSLNQGTNEFHVNLSFNHAAFVLPRFSYSIHS